jgi:hypothetical protein
MQSIRKLRRKLFQIAVASDELLWGRMGSSEGKESRELDQGMLAIMPTPVGGFAN